MSAKPSIFQRIKAGVGGFVRGFDGGAWLAGTDSAGRSGAITDPLEQAEIVYACVRTIAENVANLPFTLVEGSRQGGERVESGPAWELFQQPHPDISRFEFWEMACTWQLLRGRAYVVGLDRNGNAVQFRNRLRNGPVPVSLVLLNPDRLTLRKSGHVLLGYRYNAGAGDFIGSRDFTPEQVERVRFPNIWDKFEGNPPAAVAMLAAQTDRYAALFMSGLMQNNADQGVIVTTDQMLGDDQVKQLDALLRGRKRQAGTADKPLILFGGLKVEKPPIAAADALFLENRGLNRKNICAIFGVPESLLGFTTDANRSTSESDRLSFLQYRILPYTERLCAGVRAIVRAFDDGYDCFFDAEQSPAMQEARRGRFAGAVQAWGMGVPLNVANDVFDLGLPEGLPGGGDCLRPFSLESVGTYDPDGTAVPSEAKPEPAPATPMQEGFQALAKLLSLSGSAASKSESENANSPAHQCASPAAYAAAIRGAEKAKAAKVRRFFFEQRGRVLQRLETELAKSSSVASAKSGPLTRGIEELFPFGIEDEALRKLLKPALLLDLGFGGAQMWREIGAAGSFQLSPAGAAEFLAERASAIRGINETTWSALRGEIGAGVEAGESYAEIAERVKEVYGDASDRRAETIAITETNIAINSGRFQAMEQAGVERKGWLASNLESTRPAHSEAGERYGTEERAIPVDDTFMVGGEQLLYPGDPSGSPGNVINCRCTTFAVLDEPEGEAAGIRRSVACIPAKFLSWEEHLGETRTNAPRRSGGGEDTSNPPKNAP